MDRTTKNFQEKPLNNLKKRYEIFRTKTDTGSWGEYPKVLE